MMQASFPGSADVSAQLVFPCVHTCCKDAHARTHTYIHRRLGNLGKTRLDAVIVEEAKITSLKMLKYLKLET